MTVRATISAIVPARNEEGVIAQAVESLAAQPEVGEIIVINDESTDGTGDVLRELRGRVPQLSVLETGELPEGWVGKNYAVSLGAARASGAWLLFTDADAMHLPGSAGRALEAAARTGAALVSYSPEQAMWTWWEKAVIPFVYSRLAENFSYAEVSDPESRAAAANGQYLMIRRDAYEAVGGHGGVAGEVLEDVALARRAKQAGFRIHFAPGKGIARVRMYRSFAAMWQGWTKNLYPLVGGTPGRVRRELGAVIPWIPLLLLFGGFVQPMLALVGGLLLAGRHAVYGGVLRRNEFPVSASIYYLPAVAVYAAVLAGSARRYALGKVAWKGREYSAGLSSR